MEAVEASGEEVSKCALALAMFDTIDSDGDGALDRTELQVTIERVTGEQLADNVLISLLKSMALHGVRNDDNGEITRGKRSEMRPHRLNSNAYI